MRDTTKVCLTAAVAVVGLQSSASADFDSSVWISPTALLGS
jgi:hypothetical protein